MLVDQQTQAEYVPLNNIRADQARFEAFDSLLSRGGVLGFDYGYSLADPHTLVLWEAQFGDFANGAQVIIDQFIASGETKWLRMSRAGDAAAAWLRGPGAGAFLGPAGALPAALRRAEHAGLQLTTPANYFHALRRQLKAQFRKPLVVMTPKSLLRHKLAVSSLAEFGPGSAFKYMIPRSTRSRRRTVKRVVLCSGKVYYDLLQDARDKRRSKDVAIIRRRAALPLPGAEPGAGAGAPTRTPRVVWCQEEPENMGAWTFVDRRIERVLKGLDIKAKRPRIHRPRGSGEPGHRPRQGPRSSSRNLVRRRSGSKAGASRG